MTILRRSRTLAWLHPLLAALLLTAFGSNSAVPGLLHGCGAKVDGAAAPMQSMHHGGHEGHEAPARPCACVDHGCCSVGLVVALSSTAPVAAVASFDPPVLSGASRIDVLTPDYLQPYPVGPPALN